MGTNRYFLCQKLVAFTRSRSYHQNDHARVEQKNYFVPIMKLRSKVREGGRYRKRL